MRFAFTAFTFGKEGGDLAEAQAVENPLPRHAALAGDFDTPTHEIELHMVRAL
jgi:hypothetical protein